MTALILKEELEYTDQKNKKKRTTEETPKQEKKIEGFWEGFRNRRDFLGIGQV